MLLIKGGSLDNPSIKHLAWCWIKRPFKIRYGRLLQTIGISSVKHKNSNNSKKIIDDKHIHNVLTMFPVRDDITLHTLFSSCFSDTVFSGNIYVKPIITHLFSFLASSSSPMVHVSWMFPNITRSLWRPRCFIKPAMRVWWSMGVQDNCKTVRCLVCIF